MKNLLLDTDTLSYYFKQHPQVVANFNNHIAQQGSIFISRISVVEILGGLKAKNASRQIANFKSFLVQHTILDTTEASADISADIFRNCGKKENTAEIMIF